MAHSVRLTIWLRVIIAVIGLGVVGPALAALAFGISWHRLGADDLFALVVAIPSAAVGILLLTISIAGRTPRWLPLHGPGVGQQLVFGVVLGTALAVTPGLESWLHSRIRLGRSLSWWLSLLPAIIAFIALPRRVQRAADAPTSRPAA